MRISYLIFVLLYTLSAKAQQPNSFLPATNKKAMEAYEKSTQFVNEKNFEKATFWIDEALKLDSTFAEAHFRKAQLYEIFTEYDLALHAYRKAITLMPQNPQFTPAYQKLIEYHLRAGAYAQVRQDLEQYMILLKPNSMAYKRAQRQLEISQYGEQVIKNPLIINPEELSDTVNSYILQYFPSLTADGETLLFTALKPENDEDLFITTQKDGKWSIPVSISDKINTIENEGTGTLSADGHTLVFTACGRKDGYGSCDLYISHKKGTEWEKPKNLGVAINTPFWESQPALSTDGRVLYFVSDRRGNIGGRDIWYSYQKTNGEWATAQNLGKPINTFDDEASPFLHANGRTLFFASQGHENLGGYDLFFADSSSTGWQSPQNLGYPINTSDNQVALIITTDNQYGYYSLDTKRLGNQRISRLYRFALPKQLKDKFNAANSLKGTITDAKTNKPLEATIELIDLQTNKVVQRFQSDGSTGYYLTALPNGREWGLYISSSNHFYKSLSFDYSKKATAEGYRLDIKLEPLQVNNFGVLSNIYFETGKADLQEKSRTELNKLVELMKKQPALRIEVAGHTDDVGDAKQNLLLSQKRSQSVVNYLIGAGVQKERIKSIGYGESKPIVPNNSDENRQLNRRIEWKIW